MEGLGVLIFPYLCSNLTMHIPLHIVFMDMRINHRDRRANRLKFKEFFNLATIGTGLTQ